MFKKYILNNKIIGSWITIPSEIIVEIIVNSNYDFHVIDLEHSNINIYQFENLIRIIQTNNKPAFVRVTNNDEFQIKRVLDSGADGLILPNITDRIKLDKILNFIYYPPKGNRGVGLSRASMYGDNFQTYYKNFNKKISIIIIIENISAVENLDEILNNNNIDAVMIGPYDLSASMGIPGDFNNSKFKSLLKYIRHKTNKYNKKIGFHLVEPKISKLRKLKKEFDFIFYSIDTQLIKKSINEL